MADQIGNRWPTWSTLKGMLKHVSGLKDSDVYLSQSKKIEEQRLLLADPDPVAPLLSNVAQSLRVALNDLSKQYNDRHEQGMNRLRNDSNWKQLEPEQRNELLSEQLLTESAKPKINVETTEDILKTLEQFPLSMLTDRVAAMSSRFDEVLMGAAILLEPELQFIKIPKRTLKSESDIEEWLDEVKEILLDAIKNGPIGLN